MPAPKSPPKFDHRTVEFPTDSIKLAQMRRREPGLFTRESLMKPECPDALATYALEYTLASKAFARSLGVPDPCPTSDRAEVLSALNDAYKEYGLSTGIQQTRQFVRDLEAAAVRQAEQYRGVAR